MSTSNYINQSEYNIPILAFEPNEGDEEACYFLYEEEADNIRELDETLDHFDISLKGGYYSGAQLYIEPRSYEAKEVEEFIENGKVSDEGLDIMTDYYTVAYDEPTTEELMDAKEAVEEIDAELEYIRTKVVKNLLNRGFVKLDVVGTFSNGETVYRLA